MDSIIEAKKKQTETIYDLLKDCKISNEDHKSSKEPFFLMDISKKFKVGFKDIPELPSSLNRHFKLFYEIVSNPKIEVYIGEWIMMSLNEVLENYKQLCSKGQETVFDIGYRYKGMGHIEVIACDLSNHLLFFRNDGGSNGYDREDNYQNLLKYNPGDKKYLYFTQWKDSIIN